MRKLHIAFIVCAFVASFDIYANQENFDININAINSKLDTLQKEYLINKQKCYKDFFVNSCLEKHKQNFYAKSDELDKKRFELNQQKRQQIFVESVERRAKLQQQLESESENIRRQEEENKKMFEEKKSQDDKRKISDSNINNINIASGINIANHVEFPIQNVAEANNTNIAPKNSINKPHHKHKKIGKGYNTTDKLKERQKRKEDLDKRKKNLDEYVRKNQQ